MQRYVWVAALLAGCGGRSVLTTIDAGEPPDAEEEADAAGAVDAPLRPDATAGDDARVPVVPTIVAEAPDEISSLWADGEAVYWAAGGTIARRDAASGATLTISTGEYGPLGLVGDGAWLYWTIGASVRRSPDDAAGAIDLVPSQTNAFLMVRDDTNLYWTEYSLGQVKTASLAGGPATILATGLSTPNSIAETDDHVYFQEIGGPEPQIRRVAKSPPGAPIIPIAASFYLHGVFATTGDRIYWIEDKTLMMFDEGEGGFAQPVVTELAVLRGATATDDYVYWITGSTPSNTFLRRMPLAGGYAETLAAGFTTNAYTELRVGGSILYWFAGNEVLAVAL
jgi:hypothetical protein